MLCFRIILFLLARKLGQTLRSSKLAKIGGGRVWGSTLKLSKFSMTVGSGFALRILPRGDHHGATTGHANIDDCPSRWLLHIFQRLLLPIIADHNPLS